MKILQITPYYLPHTGGIERYVYNLSQYLISKGHTVDIATANVPESNTKETIDGTTIYRYPQLCTLMGNPIITNLSDLKRRLKDYDIIHIHGVYTYAALRTVLFLGKKHKQKVLLTHHGRVVYPNSPKNILAKIYERIVVRFILRRLDCTIVLSESDKEQFMSLGMPGDKINIIPNGIDTNAFVQPDAEVMTYFTEKYHLNRKKVILFLAVLSERKGIFDLLHAYALMQDEETVLLIVGNGPDKEKAKELSLELNLSETVTFAGKLPFIEILCAYARADTYVLPSYFEGMPTTVMEALVMGCPVVATSIPGVKDNFADEAVLVDPGNIRQLSDAIRKSLSETHEIDTNTLRRKYDAKKVFEKYSRIYT
ncbi:MAG: glycosyltransferase family 4 protein [Methanocorpusculum sp.]|nr:glycosyltransferase family 4 protein [Methanocorpusculum sp.]MBQ4597469.1 glycosyltransferase family 4 protein [Methanocorpusculum sp.]